MGSRDRLLVKSPHRGITIRGNSLRLQFQYEGKTIKETLPWRPTLKNLNAAADLLDDVKRAIRLDSFSFEQYFPDSTHVLSDRAHRNITVDEAINQGLATRVLAASTLKGYLTKHKQMVSPTLGNNVLRKLRRTDVEKVIADWSKAYSAKTINDALAVLRAGFKWAFDQGLISTDITAEIRNPSPEDKGADPYPIHDISRLLQTCEPHFQNMLEVWVTTGLRPSEVRALRWEDVDLDNRRLYICRAFVLGELKTTKTKRHRIVKFGPRAAAALRAQQRISGNLTHGFVFTKRHNDEPWHGTNDLFCALRERCRKAGIQCRAPKQLRHTYASIALSSGESPFFVAAQLGHKDLMTLRKTYAKWMPDANPTAGQATESALNSLLA